MVITNFKPSCTSSILFFESVPIFSLMLFLSTEGYHMQTGNKDNFLSLDLGLMEFGPRGIRSAVTSEFHPSTIVPTYEAGRAGVFDAEERLNGYRRYFCEAGALDHPRKRQVRVIENDIVEHEQKKSYEIKRIDRFRYSTRYFTDSGIIGAKEFVSENYQRFKDLLMNLAILYLLPAPKGQRLKLA